MKLVRPLDAVEVRVLGSLLEKEQATPDNYPLTLNALVNACNQKTNREPVTELSNEEIAAATERLYQQRLVWKHSGSRSLQFQHAVDDAWGLDAAQKAIVTLLFLRGPQTPGELRGRSERLHGFATIEEVDEALRSLAAGPEPLVRELARRPGQKETRFVHLAAREPDALRAGLEEPAFRDASPGEGQAPSAPRPTPSLEGRVTEIEERLEDLARQLAELRRALGESA